MSARGAFFFEADQNWTDTGLHWLLASGPFWKLEVDSTTAVRALSATSPAKELCHEKSFARCLHVDYWQFVPRAGAITGHGGKLRSPGWHGCNRHFWRDHRRRRHLPRQRRHKYRLH